MYPDPLKGIYLNNRYYLYANGSYAEDITVDNTASKAQQRVDFGVNGLDSKTFSLEILLQNNYVVTFGSSDIGATTWQGSSQLADMLGYLNGLGNSMPLHFVTPYGASVAVVPIGRISVREYLETARDTGTEFRVNLTLKACA